MRPTRLTPRGTEQQRIIVAIILVPVLFIVVTYNSLVSLRNYIRESWSNIDTELKRRYELIPNLVAGLFGFPPEGFFDVQPAVREVPDVGNS
ncbi:MAG: hypothetical protein WCI95_05880 [bacterium]